jgi:hypothetical protein
MGNQQTIGSAALARRNQRGARPRRNVEAQWLEAQWLETGVTKAPLRCKR